MRDLRLTKTGAEILDCTPMSLPVSKFSQESETQQILQAVIQRELAKLRKDAGLEPQEEFEDEFDFDIEDDTPKPTAINRYSNVTKRELAETAKNGKKQKKSTDDEVPVVRKSAKTDRAKRVELDERKTDKLARDNAKQDAASEEDET